MRGGVLEKRRQAPRTLRRTLLLLTDLAAGLARDPVVASSQAVLLVPAGPLGVDFETHTCGVYVCECVCVVCPFGLSVMGTLVRGWFCGLVWEGSVVFWVLPGACGCVCECLRMCLGGGKKPEDSKRRESIYYLPLGAVPYSLMIQITSGSGGAPVSGLRAYDVHPSSRRIIPTRKSSHPHSIVSTTNSEVE